MATQKEILQEITPLAQSDCFHVFSSNNKSVFDLPIHYHKEFELNFIINGKGIRRVVGDHVEEISDLELVLIGPELQHAWFQHKCKSTDITEVTIQFHSNLFEESFLRRNQLAAIRNMLEKAQRGILFSYETTKLLSYRIMRLYKKDGCDLKFDAERWCYVGSAKVLNLAIDAIVSC